MSIPACFAKCHCPSSVAAVHHQQPQLVIAQCQAGIVGSMPALNARPAEQLDEWLAEITETLAAYNKPTPTSLPRPLPSTRSCTRATTAWSTTCRCAPSTRCRSSSRPWARARM